MLIEARNNRKKVPKNDRKAALETTIADSTKEAVRWKDTKVRLYEQYKAGTVATSALAIRVISTYVLREIPSIGYNMIWWNTIFGWGIGCIITWVHFLRGEWKKKAGMPAAQQNLVKENHI